MQQFLFKIIKTCILVFVIVWSFFTALFLGVIFLMFLGLGIGLATQKSEIADPVSGVHLEYSSGDVDSEHQFVTIPIEGVILGEPLKTDSFLELFSELGVTYGYEVKDQLTDLAQDEEVDGVILEIHSPGGTLYGTRAITDGVEEFKKVTGKPVYAYIGSVAASGGYWVAASADKIVADAGTTIGSIGVIMGPFKYYDTVISESEGLFGTAVDTKNGVSTEYITAGESKDLGNPYRKMTDKEKQVLQSGTNRAYQSFVDYVSDKRQLSTDKIKNEIGALVYSEYQAKDLGLIDETGSKESTYLLLARDLGIADDDFKIMQTHGEPGIIKSWFSSFLNKTPVQNLGLSFCHQPAIMAYMGNPSVYCP